MITPMGVEHLSAALARNNADTLEQIAESVASTPIRVRFEQLPIVTQISPMEA